MSEPRITIHPTVTTPDPDPRPLSAELWMHCLSCARPMIRGTQCRACGAWCR